MQTSPGAALALLLLNGFEAMTAQVVAELARLGHPGVTSTHEFALIAIDGGAADASALGRELGVSKQAAAKTIQALEQLGYVERTHDPADGRRRPLHVTERGYAMNRLGGEAFTRLRGELARRLGTDRLEELESALAQIASLKVDGSRSADSV